MELSYKTRESNMQLFPQEGLNDTHFTEEIRIVLAGRILESLRSSALAVLCRPRLMTKRSPATELGFLLSVGNIGSQNSSSNMSVFNCQKQGGYNYYERQQSCIDYQGPDPQDLQQQLKNHSLTNDEIDGQPMKASLDLCNQKYISEAYPRGKSYFLQLLYLCQFHVFLLSFKYISIC